MKTKSIFAKCWLLLLLAILPLCSMAQAEKKPYLCIEKTDGNVIKVPITETSPDLWYSNETDSQGQMVRCLLVVTEDEEDMIIPCIEVKQLTTTFEEESGVEAITAEALSDVYTTNGIRVGSSDNLKDMPKGIYMLKRGSRTTKYIVR